MPTSPSRRAVLGALAATALAGTAGCSTPWGDLRVQPLGGDPPPPTPEPGPDELARRGAVTGVLAVLAELDRGALDAATAAPLRAALGEQLVALGEPVPSSGASSTPTASSAASAPAGSTAAATTPAAADPPDDAGRGSAVAVLLAEAAQGARGPVAEVAGGTARLVACLAAGLDVAAGWVLTATGGAGTPTGTGAGPSSASSAASTGDPSRPVGTGPSASPTPAGGTGEQAALVAALRAEEAAEYGYGVLAVHLERDQRTRATADLAAHALAVQDLREALLAQGAGPPGPPPAFGLPAPVGDAASAVALAVRLEGAVTAARADVVAASGRERRAEAAAQVLTAAQRWQAWRVVDAATAGSLVALPGLSGR